MKDFFSVRHISGLSVMRTLAMAAMLAAAAWGSLPGPAVAHNDTDGGHHQPPPKVAMCHQTWNHHHASWVQIWVDQWDVHDHLHDGDFAVDAQHPCPPAPPAHCPEGQVGTPPNCTTPEPVDMCPDMDGVQTSADDCTTPEPEQCPEGEVGTPPDCTTPEPEVCPEDQVGTPPDCTTPQEPEDMCPDDEGVQTSTDECTQPEPVDMCPDIEGIQTSADDCAAPEPEDVCPNDEGVQTSTDECTPEDTGSSGETPAEETTTQTTTHHSSGGGGGVVYCTDGQTEFCRPRSAQQGLVLGASTEEPASCSEYLHEYIKFGGQNSSDEVLKLQTFLNGFEGDALELTGVYDEATERAVRAFQEKYAGVVLAPWGATRSTGYVYYTTKKTINEIYCNFTRQFSLTPAQEADIQQVKTLTEAGVDPFRREDAALDSASSQTGEEQDAATSSTPSHGNWWSTLWGGIFRR